ncbi:hypothetical protein [Ulvibacterium sp.]|uniref:hypothetical protein n=1 Tax=Ulvibacterium sp. TaxID=2665914 RepID=UPI003BA9E70D
MEKYKPLIDEMTRITVEEGYSSKDAFSLVVKQYIDNKWGNVYLNSYDLEEIFARGASAASNIIYRREKKGTLKREPKVLKENPLTGKPKTKSDKKFSPLFSNIYGTHWKLRDKMSSKWKELSYKHNNQSKAINEMIKFYGINIDDPSDKKFVMLLDVVKEHTN